MADAIKGCAAATPCDQALVADCADMATMLSDPYLGAAATCIDGGGVPQKCLVDGLASLQPTEAQKAFGKQFCKECVLGLPGCEEQLFSGTGDDTGVAGKLIMPLGDSLVNQLASECATGIGCAATFSNCAQGVLAKRALPENTLKCLLDTLTGNVEADGESTCSNDDNPTSSTGSTSGSTVASSSAAGGPDCTQALDCPLCYCEQDPNGCSAYGFTAFVHLYCGGECGMACYEYCNTADPTQISMDCDACTYNINCAAPTTPTMDTDCQNAAAECQAMPECAAFDANLSTCPGL